MGKRKKEKDEQVPFRHRNRIEKKVRCQIQTLESLFPFQIQFQFQIRFQIQTQIPIHFLFPFRFHSHFPFHFRSQFLFHFRSHSHFPLHPHFFSQGRSVLQTYPLTPTSSHRSIANYSAPGNPRQLQLIFHSTAPP